MLKESLEFGIYHVRDGTADYKQRESENKRDAGAVAQTNSDV